MDFSNINWKRAAIQPGIPILLLVLVAFAPLYGSGYIVTMFTYFILYIIITVSWTIFSGATGYISLASAAFYGVGIYAAAMFGERMPFIFVIFIAGFASFVLAFIVGAITLRLRGIYFAMFTFGLVVLMKEVIHYWEITIEGTRGHFVIYQSNETIFYYLLGIFVVTIIVAYIIRRSKFGLALASIGENEEAAGHTGINVTMVKIITFAVSAIFMAAAGAVMATKLTYIDPGVAFNPMMSFSPALMAIFGGMASIYGPVAGAVIFSYLQELLMTGSLKNYYMLIFGAILVATIIYLPSGVTGLIQNLWRRFKGARSAPTRG
ncbi:MAG: branched-chain amino acid ABC transporter permease [Dehalococcoidales bacterium]|nr:branched-chain amino acid ABC transporter permease [Dehalococcoidales bacterium]